MKSWFALGIGALTLAMAAWLWLAPDPAPVAMQCHPGPGQTLTVACSDDCGPFNRRALRKAAGGLGYRIALIDNLSRRDPARQPHVDALLIPGGADIDPRWYRGTLPAPLQQRIRDLDHTVVYSREGRRRDPFEYRLLAHYSRDPGLSQTPVLGICRGMQLLAVVEGLPLYVDIASELGIPARRYRFDQVRVDDAGATIAALLGTAPFQAFELHHQAINLDYLKAQRSRFTHLSVTATSHGGRIAEVLEFGQRPVLGTQFHPELSLQAVRAPIFRWLLEEACRKHRAESVR